MAIKCTQILKSKWFYLVIAFSAIWFVAMASSKVEPVGVDSDGDGLYDHEEKSLGTSPFDKDTDGDGYSDYLEVVELQSSENTFHFNPRIADLPDLTLVLGNPIFTYDYQSQSGTRESTETTMTTGNGGSTGNEVGAHANYGVNSEVGASYTHRWSEEWNESIAEAKRTETESSTTKTGGRIRVLVKLRNTGHIAYKIDALRLVAFTTKPGDLTATPIRNVELDTVNPFAASMPLAPGDEKELMYIVKDLDLETVEDLLSGVLTIRVGSYSLLDDMETPFAHRLTTVRAKTAMLTIDDGKTVASFHVSTHDEDGSSLSIAEVLHELGSKFETDSVPVKRAGKTANVKGLTMLNGKSASLKHARYWVVSHMSVASKGVATIHNPLDEDYDFNRLSIRAGHSIRLSLVRDNDWDGLSNQKEKRLGTNPTKADTDGDTLGDREEIEGWDIVLDGEPIHVTTNPLVKDSDEDGSDDAKEKAELTNPNDIKVVEKVVVPIVEDIRKPEPKLYYIVKLYNPVTKTIVCTAKTTSRVHAESIKASYEKKCWKVWQYFGIGEKLHSKMFNSARDAQRYKPKFGILVKQETKAGRVTMHTARI